jgi:hypothetical protein
LETIWKDLHFALWRRSSRFEPDVPPQRAQHPWGNADVRIPQKPSLSDACVAGSFSPVWYLVGHLKPGISIPDARADLTTVANQLGKIYPKSYPADFIVELVSFTDMVVGLFRSMLSVPLAAVGLLWLVACANVAICRWPVRRHAKENLPFARRSEPAAGASSVSFWLRASCSRFAVPH